MRRKTNLYHRLWYVRHNRKIECYVVIVLMVFILILFLSFVEKRLRVCMTEFSEYRVKSIVTRVVGNAVNDNFPDNIDYNDIVTISKDENGRITSIQTEVARLNRLFANVFLDIQEQLSGLENEKLTIPLGAIFGNSIFAASGPGIKVKVIPAGSVEMDFKSEFTSAGINQTRHRIYLLVNTEVGVVVPFNQKKTVIATSMPVAETVIVGEVPNYYVDFGNQ